MANIFTRHTGAAGTSPASLYTVQSGKTAIVIGLTLANKAASSRTVTLMISGVSYLIDAPIPAGSTLSALDGKLVLEEDDSIVVSASASDSIDVYISVLEQS